MSAVASPGDPIGHAGRVLLFVGRADKRMNSKHLDHAASRGFLPRLAMRS
jgi:hypothetical protein